MPYRDPDPEDPVELIGVEISVETETVREMAWAFAQEFARMGFERERLIGLFRKPHYAAAHRAYRILGESEIERVVDECIAFRAEVQSLARERRNDGSG